MEKPTTPESGRFEIEELGAEDWQEVKELRLKAVQTSPRAFGDTPEEVSAMGEDEWRSRFNTGRYFCVREGGKLVGMMCLVRETGDKTRHIASVRGVFVDDSVRGRGIGRALLERVIDEARSAGLRKLQLCVDTKSAAAQGLYESMGFERVSEKKEELFVDGEYVDEYDMELFLDK